jgi:superfamily II DNA/RNA helicase
MLKVPFVANINNWPPPVANKVLFTHNAQVAATLNWLTRELIPPDWQTLMFIQNEKAAERFLEVIGKDGTIAMAKKMNKTQRRELMALMQGNVIKRCLASNIYAQGVTFSDVRCVMNLAGGGPYTGTIQKPGRLAEIRPGKKCGVMIDFILQKVGDQEQIRRRGGWDMLIGNGWQRHKTYIAKGYDVSVLQVTDRAAISQWFAGCV